MIIDTDLLIDYFRGYRAAEERLHELDRRSISIVTLFELYQGARDARELGNIRAMVKEWDIEVIAFTEDQSYQTLFLMEKYSLSHGLTMADAMIAACAIITRQTVFTGNYRDYRFISDITVKRYSR